MKDYSIRWICATLADEFIFQKFITKEENCKDFMYALFGKQIERVVYRDLDRFMKEGFDPDGIKATLYLRDEDMKYNIQILLANTDLEKRSRCIQSSLALSAMEQEDDYYDKTENYVIIITEDDPFGKGNYIYKVARQCLNVDGVDCEDDNYTLFLNPEGSVGEISEELRIVFDAINGEDDWTWYASEIRREINDIKEKRYNEMQYYYKQEHDNALKNQTVGK